MRLNLGSILQASAESRSDHVAVRLNDRVLRYQELDRAARGFAAIEPSFTSGSCPESIRG